MTSRAVKVIAGIEVTKGVLVLLASSSVLSLVHRDVHATILGLVEHFHLNPAAKYPQIFLRAADNLHDGHLVLLAVGALAYSILRFVEAFGLYKDRAWAECVAAASGSIYLPFEVFEILKNATWLHAVLLTINLLVVAVMVKSMHQRMQRRKISASAR